ncbi:MAG: hypothetical protein OXB88_05615 [Bacteriovoracales bacterium]|nr:hypothetical protein [Bacteriovoracales bacterium]
MKGRIVSVLFLAWFYSCEDSTKIGSKSQEKVHLEQGGCPKTAKVLEKEASQVADLSNEGKEGCSLSGASNGQGEDFPQNNNADHR